MKYFVDEENNCEPLSASPGGGPPQTPTWWAKEIQRSLQGGSIKEYPVLVTGVFPTAGRWRIRVSAGAGSSFGVSFECKASKIEQESNCT